MSYGEASYGHLSWLLWGKWSQDILSTQCDAVWLEWSAGIIGRKIKKWKKKSLSHSLVSNDELKSFLWGCYEVRCFPGVVSHQEAFGAETRDVSVSLTFSWHIEAETKWPQCRLFADDIFKCISINEHCWTLNKISLKFVPLGLINTLRPRQNGRHLPDDIFKCISLNENVWISIEISLKFVRKGSINNIPALVQIMAWRRPGDKPLSEPMIVRLPTHICVTRPQRVNNMTGFVQIMAWHRIGDKPSSESMLA